MPETTRHSPFVPSGAQGTRVPGANGVVPAAVHAHEDMDLVTRRSLQLNASHSIERNAHAFVNELMPEVVGSAAPPAGQGSIHTTANKSFAFRVADGLNEPSPSSSNSSTAHGDVQIIVAGEDAGVSKLMDPITAENQLVLSFHHINGWVPLMATKEGFMDKWKKARANKASKAAATSLEEGKAQVIDGSKNPPEAQEAATVKETNKVRRQVLYDLSGKVNPGELLALMGPSGSGKTTLLSVIGGRTPKMMKRTGQVLVNGQPFTKLTRRHIGFVLQDDVLHETLTVQETLNYAAMLRLPKEMTTAQKISRTDAVVNALGLSTSRNTIIGGYFRRGVSGGERKRVSIGTELLINPSILMLDEPTSGLDSTTAMHLITLLRELAAGGRAILTTIHQPSSRLYEQLDQLLLLAEGHAMYYGNAQLVVDWFQYFGFKLRFGVSMSDFILDVAQGEVESESHVGHSAIKALSATFEQWYQYNPEGFQDTGVLVNIGGLADPGQMVPELSFRGVKKSEGQVQSEEKKNNTGDGSKKVTDGSISSKLDTGGKIMLHGRRASFASTDSGFGGKESNGVERRGIAGLIWGRTPRVGAPYWQQYSILVQRAARVRRFESLTGNNLFQLVAVAVVSGLLWWQKGRSNTLQAGADILGLIFFEELFLAMRTLFSALFTFPDEFRMLTKERASGMYQVSAYYLARTTADLPFEMFFSVIFVFIIYWLGGLRVTAGAFFANLFTMLLTVLVAQSWGLLLGGIFMHPKKAQTVTTVVMLTFLLVGGYYVRSIPVWISWIKYISFLYWGFNLLLKIEFSGRSLEDCTTKPCTQITDLEGALRLPSDPNASPALDACMLMLMLVVLRIVIYFVLRKKTAALGK